MLTTPRHGQGEPSGHRGGVRRAGAREPAPHPAHPRPARRRAAVGVPRHPLPAQLADHHPAPERPREGGAHRGSPRGPLELLPPPARARQRGAAVLARTPRTGRPREDLGADRTAIDRRAARPPHHTKRKRTMTATGTDQTDVPKIFRVTVEVSNLDDAAAFYARLLASEGKRHPGARHYFDCGGVILAVIDPTQGGLAPTPGPKSIYFAV